jgi:putative addiction module component (TIGR02574 family)
MNARVNHIFVEALTLSVEERVALLQMLSENISVHQEASLSPEWLEEIARRKTDYKNGLVKAVPWEEAKARFLAL